MRASAPSRKYLGIRAPLHPLPLRCASSPYSTGCLSRALCGRGAATLSVRQAIYETVHYPWKIPLSIAVTAKNAAANRTTVAPVAVSREYEAAIPKRPEATAMTIAPQKAETAPRAMLRADAAGATGGAVT